MRISVKIFYSNLNGEIPLTLLFYSKTSVGLSKPKLLSSTQRLKDGIKIKRKKTRVICQCQLV